MTLYSGDEFYDDDVTSGDDNHAAHANGNDDPECALCFLEMRESLNVEGDPTRNGAFG